MPLEMQKGGRGRGDARDLAQLKAAFVLLRSGCLYRQKGLLKALGVCVGAAPCLGAINCRFRSINRINVMGLRH